MITKPFPDDLWIVSWMVVGFFSAWSGVVRYLMDHPTGKWSCAGMISQVVISGFTGFLGGFYAYEYNYSGVMTIAMAGVSGTFGGSLLRWLWLRFIRQGEKPY
ncbi:phage holin family protein [Mixta intestinalis]|jgi:uncharacterized membrane protein YeaQ/YmgE (transglycosylase-associated protein family)|uniref:Holin n=1 Tax=Mixta intestinalis TaxID=1615494 RepID=A0A6P1Q2H8_9GAMM|nr:phage holin family protein [Mixta intestinalis]QHM72434.1 hypothetical protein C7M51_02746 [Mixta intestinalis]